VLVLFGGVFPLLAWAATLRAVPLSISVRSSASALIALTGYVILLSLYLIGGPQWIDQHLPHSWADSAQIKFFIGLAKKRVVFVVIPFVIFFSIRLRLSSSRFRDSARRSARAARQSSARCTGGRRSFPLFPILRQQWRRRVSTRTFYGLSTLCGFAALFRLACFRSGTGGRIFLSRCNSVAAGNHFQIRSKRRRIDVANLWPGACTWFHFSTCRRS
jgi:hypothetical protein